MKILITGANGFVGKALTSFLQPFNFEIIQLGNSKEINLSDFNQVMKIPKVDIIIHLETQMELNMLLMILMLVRILVHKYILDLILQNMVKLKIIQLTLLQTQALELEQ